MVSLMDASWMRLLMNENLMVIGLSWDYLFLGITNNKCPRDDHYQYDYNTDS